MTKQKSLPRVVCPTQADFQPRFAYGHMAEAAVAVGPEDGTKLGSGFVRLRNARIPWTIRYDEVILVVEGWMTVETAGGALKVEAGQMIWLPEGTSLTYVADDCLCFYAIHPNDWAQGLDLSTLSS